MIAIDVAPMYRSGVRQFGVRLHAVGADQWRLPTPAGGWTVADLVRHVVDGQRDVPRVLAGTPLPREKRAGADPGGLVAEWGTASAAAVAALSAPSGRVVLDRDGRRLTEIDYGRRMVIELTVHAWDLARATGQSGGAVGEFPNDLLSATLGWAKESDSWRRGDRYAPAIPVPGCTEDLVELLALTGRNRWWRTVNA